MSLPQNSKDTLELLQGRGVSETKVSTSGGQDDRVLARLGKKPVLKRNFGFMAILGFSCTSIITWEATQFTFLTGLTNGGPAGMVYGYLFVWAGMLSINITLGELASMAPTSGGQYHWVSILAPPRYRRFIGYVTGWFLCTGWQAITASAAYMCATMLQGVAVLTHRPYLEQWQNWHGTLLLWVVILLSVAVCTVSGTFLAKFEWFVMLVHLLGFFAIMLPLVLLSEKAQPKEVFTTFRNDGEWPTQGLSWCIGTLGTVFAFLGGDSAVHMSEEIRNAPVVVPRSLISGLMINGFLGFVMLIITLFCMGDVDAALRRNPSYPFMEIYQYAVSSTTAAAVMACIIMIMAFAATTSCLASTSRVYWAFARDQGLPYSTWLKKLSPRTSVPLNAVAVTTVLSCILSLVNIGDATAFNGVISISMIGICGSYLIVATLLLYRRMNGDIQPPRADDVLTNTMGTGLTWGPWRLHGAIGLANNMFSCAFLAFTFFFAFWPARAKITPENMNWAVLVAGIALLFSISYYLLHARKTYRGPIVEVEVRSNRLDSGHQDSWD